MVGVGEWKDSGDGVGKVGTGGVRVNGENEDFTGGVCVRRVRERNTATQSLSLS